MKALLLALAAALIVTSLVAAQTGTIRGVVTDAATGAPLPYANIVVVGTKLGAMALVDGTYRIEGVPPDTVTIKVMMMGYASAETTRVVVRPAEATVIDFALEAAVVGKTQEIVVEGEHAQIDVRSSDVVSAVALKGGIVKTGNDLHVRGGRSGAIQHQIDGTPVDDPLGGPARPAGACRHRPPKRRPRPRPCPPSPPLHRRACWPNTEEYAPLVENDFLDAIGNPLSTFSIDVDAGSYGNARRFIERDMIPPVDAVRIEEFVNYFDYDYPRPDGDEPFSITVEYGRCPWNATHRLVHIGLQGEQLAPEDRRPGNLVFLIDVSGSMQPPNKLPLLQKAFLLLVDELQDDDLVSIVVYAGAAGLVLPPTPGRDRETIADALQRLRAGGSTAGHAGIQLAYEIARENYIDGGNNRVILATDGDFNVGVTDTGELIRMIEDKRKEGIFLTVLGFGIGNYKDHRLEQLADKGNGNHAYIDNLLEAKKVFVDDLTGTLYTIAKDVKIQVEFNPAKVASYRLIGYENRLLKKEDFEDDTKDAGEIGAGHTVTALYEIVPVEEPRSSIRRGGYRARREAREQEEAVDDVTAWETRYLRTSIKSDAIASGEVLTVNIRYKEPDGETSRLVTRTLSGEPLGPGESSDDFRFSAAVAMYGLILRESKYQGDADLDDVVEIATKARGADVHGYRGEFIRLAERTKLIVRLAKK